MTLDEAVRQILRLRDEACSDAADPEKSDLWIINKSREIALDNALALLAEVK